MNLWEWSSNSDEFLGLLTEEKSNVQSDEIKVFGIKWNRINDSLHISGIGKVPCINTVTKRDVLYNIAWIFDPLDLVSPVVYYGKIFLQKLWKLDMSWDEPLPDNLLKDWSQVFSLLTSIPSIAIPRFVGNQKGGCVSS